MLPKAKELEIDFEALGQRMLDRKKELQKEGIPPDAEHAMVAQGKSDSRAAAAKERKALKTRKGPASVSTPRTLKSGSGKRVKSRKQGMAIR